MKHYTTLRAAGGLFLLATMSLLSSCNDAAKEAPSLSFYDCQGRVIRQAADADTLSLQPDTLHIGQSAYLDHTAFNYRMKMMEGLEEVHLTLDQELQDTANHLLMEKLEEIHADWGTAIVMETTTGDIKAMASLRNLESEPEMPMDNIAMNHHLEPGSTFKVASLLVALEDGKITPHTTVNTGNGLYPMHGINMKDWSYVGRGGFGIIDVRTVLEQSSNIGVARLIDENYAQAPELFLNGLWRVGMGRPLEMPYVRACEPKMKKVTDETWNPTSLPWISIGYESLLTPLQICTFYNGIANRGRMVRPRLVASTKKGSEITQFHTATLVEQMAPQEYIRQMQQMLENVVSSTNGTGKKARTDAFSVAGKTGSAQCGDFSSGSEEYFISFCGYFPANAPKYTCFVGMKKMGLPASGGGHCAPVFKELAEYIMK